MEEANKESPFAERGKTNQTLVELLTARGLGGQPSDILRALETVGYFRFKGYLVPLLKKDAADKSFVDGATIARAWELYTIDRKLRVMVFEALARIEVAIRALIVRSHLKANDDPMAYADAANMPNLSEAMYANLLDHIRSACRKSSAEPMIRHLKEKYGITNTPPIWTMMEVVEFGTVTLSLVAYCMGVFRPESEWKIRCRDFLTARDAFILTGMGFPSDWQKLALWK